MAVLRETRAEGALAKHDEAHPRREGVPRFRFWSEGAAPLGDYEGGGHEDAYAAMLAASDIPDGHPAWRVVVVEDGPGRWVFVVGGHVTRCEVVL